MADDERQRGDESERHAVKRTLVALIREAESQAHLVGSFLREHGIRGIPGTAETGATSPPSLSSPAHAFLLDLGAVLRLRQWELGGIKDLIAPELPCAAEALRQVTARFEDAHGATTNAVVAADSSGSLSRQVVETALRQLVNTDKSVAGDFPMPVGVPLDAVLDGLADLLWRFRDRCAATMSQDPERGQANGTSTD